MKEFKSHYLNSDMSPLDIMGKQMDFLYEEGRKLATKKLDINYEDLEADIQIQREIEKDLFEPLTSEHLENCAGCAACKE